MVFGKIKRILLGTPLASQRERHERLSIPLALSVFASDALSSTAYATEEILIALVSSAYAFQANLLSLPVAAAIALLMAVVVLSYRQVIRAFPEGGGSYQVAKDYLGTFQSQLAGAALLIDYVLTVAVSISAGVAAIVSTGLVPGEAGVTLALLFIMLMTYVNLRGVRESGQVLAFPAYFFIVCMAVLAVAGIYQVSTGQVLAGQAAAETLHPLKSSAVDASASLLNLGLLLVLLNAFSHGCAALTGIEAISNGVKAFREPIAENANRTMVLMGVILGGIFLSMTWLAFSFSILPDPENHRTVISLIAERVFGYQTWPFLAIQLATMVILILAANTSFSGFPRLSGILANDGYLPRQLMNLGDRLVFSNGILILGFLSMILVWAYRADTHALIPLYAVGVFLSFTLAQAGMVRHHGRKREPHWVGGLVINFVGALATGVVTVILAVEKFAEGAWIVLVAMPLIIWMFRAIKAHYLSIGKQLALPATGYCPTPIEHTVLVLVSSLNRGTVPALEYGKTLSDNVEAVHVELNPAATERLKSAWDEWGCGIPLTILKSPYRSLSEPLLQYIDEVSQRHAHDLVTIIVPEFVTRKWWHNLLHNQTALMIKALLRMKKGKVVTTVRCYLED